MKEPPPQNGDPNLCLREKWSQGNTPNSPATRDVVLSELHHHFLRPHRTSPHLFKCPLMVSTFEPQGSFTDIQGRRWWLEGRKRTCGGNNPLRKVRGPHLLRPMLTSSPHTPLLYNVRNSEGKAAGQTQAMDGAMLKRKQLFIHPDFQEEGKM